MVNRCELFDETDLDAALTRFEELHPLMPRLENAASRVVERYQAHFAARDWKEMVQLVADDMSTEDRRRVVNAGVLRGREVEIANARTIADLEIESMTSKVIAIRGERLVLARTSVSSRQWPDSFEIVDVVEINSDNRLLAHVMFDANGVDAAFEELDARYLAGEAAPYVHTWSVIAQAYAALNRRQLPATTPDWVNIDHRRFGTIEANALTANIGAFWDVTSEAKIGIEAVLRLSNFGAVVVHATDATTQEGVEIDSREIILLTVEGKKLNRCEIFDEADVDAARARFDELRLQTRQLENAASRANERFASRFAARDWAAIADTLADDICSDDRRRVVNAGVRRGRDTNVADLRAVANVGVMTIPATVIATRGERLALLRSRLSGRDTGPEAYHNEVLQVVEVNGDNRIWAAIVFDSHELDAAFSELDARYLAGEAAAHAQTWSVIMCGISAVNGREPLRTTQHWVNVDHRRGTTFAPGALVEYFRSGWNLTPDFRIYIESVHRLTNLGAVITHAARGTSQEGFDAEWRAVDLVTIEGELIERAELFDEADVDAALTRFEELRPQTRRLENVASRVSDRFLMHFADRDWNAMTEMTADDFCSDDRRRVVGAGVRHGRDVDIENMRAWADVGIKTMTSYAIATRGERLVLSRTRFSGPDQRHEAFHTDVLGLIEVDTDERIRARVVFDPDDIDAAFAELDARYLAGEAAAHAQAWSVIAGTYAAFNRHELPIADWVNVDHRRGTPFASSHLTEFIRGVWDVTPDLRIHIDAVHRLTGFGAVVTHSSHGTSREGFDAEWRMIQLLTVEGDRVSRCELFDEDDLDAALARFDELNGPAPLLDNAATRVWARGVDAINRKDLDNALADAAADARYEDRRKGLRDEGPMRPEVARALFDAAREWLLETEPVAIRGSRLGLTHDKYRDTVDPERSIAIEHLTLLEVDENNRGRDILLFDPDDINAALAELTARWIASGEVAHPEVIEAGCRVFEAVNRHEWEAISAANANATYVNHRQLPASGNTIADHMSSVRMMASLVPDLRLELSQILAHSASGLVCHNVIKGTSTDGAAIEIPVIVITLLDGDRVRHIEAFDLDQRDFALTRFAELSRSG
ncbi:MAG: hypothetical protein WAM92_16455 [Mycobacterium sp.]